jgi:hypothetical protein
MKLLIMQSSQPPAIYCILLSNILISILFSNTLGYERGRFKLPFKTAGKILCISIFKSVDRIREGKRI